MNPARFLVALVLLLCLGSCALEPGVRPFWDLQQAQFSQLKPGMKKSDVEALLGKPILVSTFRRMEEEVWDYRYMDLQLRMYATVHFDSNGSLKYHSERLDPAFYGGGMDR